MRKLENGEGDLEAGESELILERKCPKVLNDFTLAQPTIDRFNRYRQHILNMEERIHTRRFDFRHAQFYFAESFVNAFFAHRFFNDKSATFFDCMRILSYGMMHNALLVAENPERALPPRPDDFRGASTAGPPSAGGSSSSCTHTIVPITTVVGRKRGRAVQPRCVMCNDQCSTCCFDCSTPGNIVAVHKRKVAYRNETRNLPCALQHAKNPCSFPRGKQGQAAKAPARAGAAQPAMATPVDLDDGWLSDDM